jgi:hypothetical protein
MLASGVSICKATPDARCQILTQSLAIAMQTSGNLTPVAEVAGRVNRYNERRQALPVLSFSLPA